MTDEQMLNLLSAAWAVPAFLFGAAAGSLLTRAWQRWVDRGRL